MLIYKISSALNNFMQWVILETYKKKKKLNVVGIEFPNFEGNILTMWMINNVWFLKKQAKK